MTEDDLDYNNVDEIQEIPDVFTDKKFKASRVVKNALLIAKELDLIPENSPLRTIWYAFIKKSIENNGVIVKHPDKIFYKTFADMIKDGEWYENFNIENSGIVWKLQHPKGFKNSFICLEKESYFGVFKNFSELLGVSVYAGGGQPSLSGTEYVVNTLYELYQDTSIPDLFLFTISDYDPAGLNIANTFKSHFGMYMERVGENLYTERIGTLPEYYTEDELEQALYDVKSYTQNRWNMDIEIERRSDYDIPDTKGLEVESLPANPEPIFEDLFPEYELKEWKGQSRIRLITLHKLIETFGMENFYRNYLSSCFYNDIFSKVQMESSFGLKYLMNVNEDIKKSLDKIDKLFRNDLEPKRIEIENLCIKWEQQLVQDRINMEYDIMFTQNLIDAVATDEKKIEKEEVFSKRPKHIKEFPIDEEKKKRINKYKHRLIKILRELDQIKSDIKEELEC